MLMLFQGVFVLFSLLAIANVLGLKKAGHLSVRGALFWVLFWLAADIAVIDPSTTTHLANLFGIGRGTDFVLYVSFAALFFLFFRLQIKLEKMNRDVTKVVRDRALSSVEKK